MAGVAVYGLEPSHGLVAQEVMTACSALEGEALAAIRAVCWLVEKESVPQADWVGSRYSVVIQSP